MNEMFVKLKKTSELVEYELNDLIALKQQHWNYSVDEQKRWFADNIESEDYHLMIYQDEILLAYLNAVNVDVDIDNFRHMMLGIGNVCVDKGNAHSGIGSILIACINSFIRKNDTVGILLCKEPLIKFYEASNWTKIFPVSVNISDQSYHHDVMIFAPGKMIDQVGMKLDISRNF